MESMGKCAVVLRGGAGIAQRRLVFSSDSKFLMGCCGWEVKVWSVSSGLCVHRLKGHKAKINCITLNPANPYQLFSASEDGMVIKWDYADGIQLSSHSTKHSLVSLCMNSSADLFFGLSDGDKGSSLVSFSMSSSSGKEKIKTTTLTQKMLAQDNALSMGCDDLFAVCIGKTTLKVFFINQGKADKSRPIVCTLGEMNKQIRKSGAFCCLCAHPTEVCVATGMQDGKILTWWFSVENRKLLTTKQIHWHSLPVCDVAFTPLGSNLLSGGHENVLVKWQHNSHERSFFPRLGATITRVAVARDNNYYAVCQEDNGIQVISSDFKVIQVIQGLTQVKDQSNMGIIIDPKTGALVTKGRPGHLQFYCLKTDTQLFNLDIVCQNYISSENVQRPLVFTDVTRAAFSHDGNWLATVEERIDGKTTPEIRLKFWLYDSSSQRFSLNTSVCLPHEHSVRCLIMRPRTNEEQSLQCATTSSDCRFKLWTVADDTDIYRKRSCWACDSVGFYRNLTTGPAAYTADGSLLAVAFDSTLTLWDPDTNDLCQTLSHPDAITHVVPCLNCSMHLLITGTRSSIFVWNLLTCSIQWCSEVFPLAIVANPTANAVAIFTRENTLQIYEPQNSSPVYTHDKVSPAVVTCAAFLDAPGGKSGNHKWMGKSRLYFMNSKQELYAFEDQLPVDSEDDEESSAQKLKQDLPQSMLSLILQGKGHENRVKGQADDDEAQLGQPGAQFLSQMLTTPSHVMPNITSLCLPFVSELLQAKKSKNPRRDIDDEPSDDEMEVDGSEESNSDMETVTPSSDKIEKSEKSLEGNKTTESQIDRNAIYSKIDPSVFSSLW